MSPVRIIMPVVFMVAFILWILYRLFIKKDLKKNSNNLIAGCIFFAIWGVIYYFLLKK